MTRGLQFSTKVFFLTLLAFYGCTKSESITNIPIVKVLNKGLDSLVYDMYAPLADKPVTLYYYIPEDGNMTTMPILFALHGADRAGMYQISTWKGIADEKKIMVFAPQFSSSYYNTKEYQQGGVSKFANSFLGVSEEKWTYSIIEAMFDFIKEKTGSHNNFYDMWGHSAGAQFTHRFLLWMPNARVRNAVASNAGTYTVPDPSGYSDDNGAIYSYPYSMKDTPLGERQLISLFARHFTVHLGTKDIATTSMQDSSLPVSDGDRAQGACRYDRGHFYFNRAKAVAEQYGYEFNWTVVDVENVSHNSRGMVRAVNTGAAQLLYP